MEISLREEFQSWRFEHYPFVRANDKGLQLETSPLILLTVANLC